MTKEAKTNMLMGILGYVNSSSYKSNYKAAYDLLQKNDFNLEKIIKLHYDLEANETTNSSFISLAGEYAKIKIKMSNTENIINLINKNDVDISIG